MDRAPMERETPTDSCRFVKESQSMSLGEFASYYGHRLPQCALVDEIGYEEETRGEGNASESNDTLSPGKYIHRAEYYVTNPAPLSPLRSHNLAVTMIIDSSQLKTLCDY